MCLGVLTEVNLAQTPAGTKSTVTFDLPSTGELRRRACARNPGHALAKTLFCRLHVPSELVAVWRPDSDGRTAHGDPNHRGAHSTADCRSNVTCADGGTDEHRTPYRKAIPSPDSHPHGMEPRRGPAVLLERLGQRRRR